MQSNTSKSYLFMFAVLVLAVLSGWLYKQKEYKYGLDVRGGVRLVYSVDKDALAQGKSQKEFQDSLNKLAESRTDLIDILEKRISGSLGVSEGTVQAKGEDQFVVEIPGFTDVKRAEEIMKSTASLKGFWAKNVSTRLTKRQYGIDPASEKSESSPSVNFFKESDPTKVLKPGDAEYKAMINGWELLLEGPDLKRAYAKVISTPVPAFDFQGKGADNLEAWSRRTLNRGENLAFVLDNVVLSIAPLKDGAILKEQAEIDGTFDPGYVNNLVALLNAGALPVPLKQESSQSVDPTIGTGALDQIVKAGVISFGVICLFLVVYYLFPGFLAALALCLYVLFTLTALKWTAGGATFSLAAIAGFILSVGIAVDANILVFERVKEELREGKQLMTAVELGFKRALSAIVDSNICTILTSIVLLNFGTGPVKGFATTLIMGVVISLFTAVTVTRSLLVFLVGAGIGANPKWFGLGRQWFGENLERDAHHKPLQIVNRAKLFFAISAFTILPGIIFAFLGGFKPNVEFLGGYEVVYKVNDASLSSPQLLSKLERAGMKGCNVKFAGSASEKQVYVTVPREAVKGGDDEVRSQILAATGFNKDDDKGFTSIGPSVQKETIYNAVKGVLISSALIIIYLAFRFGIAVGGFMNGLKFGASAVLAMVHDILVVIGLSAVVGFFLGWEISALFITAMLTVIGFSVHDTIVIFDRIRENLRKPLAGEDFSNLCNRSITQSFARSINTSMTVIVTLIILIAIGTATPDLKFFCVAMLVGIVSGTYSSIYNAAPILYLWDKAVGRKKGEAATLMAEAARENARARAAQLTVKDTGFGQPAGQPAPGQYGQVRRRRSAREQATKMIDDDE